MIKFRKISLAILVTAGLITGSALARSDCGPGRHDARRFAERMEKHRARLHDRLKLSAEQEAAWKVFMEKTRPPSAHRGKAARAELRKLPTPERMDRMISLMKERESRMMERAAAVKAFYAALSPAQQKLFDEQHARRRR